MGYALRDQYRYSYGEYRTWPENQRYELVEGSAFLMESAPSLDHQTIAFEVGCQLGNALENRPCRVLLAPVDVLLPRAGEADEAVTTVVQPDVLVVCDPAKLSPRGVRGAPDWVMEVVSPASASHDQIIKLAAYERAGVREYWVVHPGDRLLSIYLHDGQGFGRPRIAELRGETSISSLGGIKVDWERILVRLIGSPRDTPAWE